MKLMNKCMRKFILLFLVILAMISKAFTQDVTLNIMPYPFKVIQADGKFRINQDFSISVAAKQDDEIIKKAANRFLIRLNLKTLSYFKQEAVELNQNLERATLYIKVNSQSFPSIGIDESYNLIVTREKIELKSNNTMGALRGLETLIQMVSADADGYFVPVSEINDSPRFKWRGMMVDAARHFIPLPILKKNIDAMAIVKLNVLHLHLSDDEGFRVESKLFPKFQQLGSNGRYYTQEELVGLVKYATDRGIIIVPEFDLPGHTRSWFAGYPELASAPGQYKPGPRFTFDIEAPREQLGQAVKFAPTPTLDPTREEVYDFLDKFLGEMTNIFPSPYFHIGADENNGVAWQKNPKIVQFMKDHDMKDTHELHTYFVNRMYKILKSHNRTMIAWQEAYSDKLPKDVILQAWISKGDPMNAVEPSVIADKGSPVIISTKFYLDLFFPSHVHYLNPEISEVKSNNLLGGEAAIWSELADENCFEGRVWPRTGAIAERLWSSSQITDVDDMYRRLYLLSDKLEEEGLNHRLNAKRWISVLADGNNIDAAFSIYEILAPFKGYRRLAANMMQPSYLKYETVPLVNLPDIVEVDSEVEWKFRKLIEQYLKDSDPEAKDGIEDLLNKWKEAAFELHKQIKVAPNLNILDKYSDRIISASNIGLKAFEFPLSESEKEKSLNQLRSMKFGEDEVEIRILDEIEGLLIGNLRDFSANF